MSDRNLTLNRHAIAIDTSPHLSIGTASGIKVVLAGGGMVIGHYRVDMERRGLSPRTITRMSRNLHAFERWMALHGGTMLTATRSDVDAFLDARRITARTRYQWLSCLHNFYLWAIREGRTELDPTEDITRPKLRRTLPRPITEADLAYALEHADREMRAWLTLASYAGLRVGEIAALRAESVMWDAGLLRVLGKGQAERMVPMHPMVVEALRACGVPRHGPVFVRPMGGAYPPPVVSRKISLFFQTMGVEATAHQMRHFFATRVYAATKDLRITQELLGHRSPDTTSVYVAFSRIDAIAAVEALKPPRSE